MVWYLDADRETFKQAEHYETGLIETIFQALQLFKGENPLDSENGVDYLAIFANEEFLTVQLDNVLQRFKDKLVGYNIGTPYDLDNGIVSVRIDFMLHDGESVSQELNLKMGVNNGIN